MADKFAFESRHFTAELLNDGVWACIHKQGGGAYSNAGVIDLGDRTILVDAFNTMAAGSDLRRLAETQFNRPVEAIVLTHPHSDHWIGASAFDASTSLQTTEAVYQVCLDWGAGILEDFSKPEEWQAWLRDMENQMEAEIDEPRRESLENQILQTRYTLAEMSDYQPRYADTIFEGVLKYRGSERELEIRSLGRGHSEEDIVVLLPREKIAFIGDIGFFDSQPFLGFCDIDLYRKQLQFFQDAEFRTLVPGHGPVGGKEDIALQLAYFDVLEKMVEDVQKEAGTFEEALGIILPEPFNGWQAAGMERFKANVRYFFEHLGGEVPELV
jgi:glyoxylase-like metal-dependent hydrolase (beta-lactamase superfamily II)